MSCRDYEDPTTLHKINEDIYADPLGEKCHAVGAVMGLDWMLDHYEIVERCPSKPDLLHIRLKSEAYDFDRFLEGAGG